MKYIYYAVTPDIIGNRWTLVDENQTSFCFVKFGITDNADLEVLRAGYTTHNPSIGFNKISYHENIQSVLETSDLGKAIQYALAQIPGGIALQQVGMTEWYAAPMDKAIALFNTFTRWENIVIESQSVQNMITQIINAVRR